MNQNISPARNQRDQIIRMVPSYQMQDHLIDNANNEDKVVVVYQLKIAVVLLFLHEFICCGTYQ